MERSDTIEYEQDAMKNYGLEPGGTADGFIQPVRRKISGKRIGSNIIGLVRGWTRPDECVYVDAHYDHWGRAGGRLQPGANDNASGIAVMLETARNIALSRPDRTIVFMASDCEEGALLPMLGGLKGAAYQAGHRSVCSKDRIKGVVVADTLGRRFIDGMSPQLFLIGSESDRAVYELAGRLADDLQPIVPVNRLGVYAIEPLGSLAPRADYGAYRGIGVPFVFATSGIPAEYHTECDTIDKIDFDFMEKAGAGILGLVRRMGSEKFRAGPAIPPDEVLDWAGELAVADRISETLLGLPGLPADKADYLARLRADNERLKTLAEAPAEHKDAVKRSIREIVMLMMKMNGSLKFREHLFRTYDGPRE